MTRGERAPAAAASIPVARTGGRAGDRVPNLFPVAGLTGGGVGFRAEKRRVLSNGPRGEG